MGAHLFDLHAEHVATTTDDWYTPRWVFDAAAIAFDIDVAAPIDPQHRIVPARRYLTVIEDGLTTPWEGVVWCYPPYSRATPWVDKWAAHPDGLMLVPAIKAPWVGDLIGASDALTILRVDFVKPDGSRSEIPSPNLLAARGRQCANALTRISRADKQARGAYLVRPG